MQISNIKCGGACLRGRAVIVLFAMRAALRLLPNRVVRRYLLRSARIDAPAAVNSEVRVNQIVGAVLWAARLVPGGNNCLAQALAARLLLARDGIASELVIGVRKDARADIKAFGAHAWLQIGERILLGAQAAPGYAPLPPLSGRL